MRDALMREGATLFVAQGTAKVSVEDIIAAAGVSRATFYGIFTNKQELLAAILAPVLEGGSARFRELADAPVDQIVPGIIRVYTDLWATAEDAMSLIAGIDPAVFAYLEDAHAAFSGALLELLQRAEASGQLANEDANLSFRVIARTAVPLLRVYSHRADWADLFRHAMMALLLRSGGPGS
jgi:AcrR family transcriptional regulator